MIWGHWTSTINYYWEYDLPISICYLQRLLKIEWNCSPCVNAINIVNREILLFLLTVHWENNFLPPLKNQWKLLSKIELNANDDETKYSSEKHWVHTRLDAVLIWKRDWLKCQENTLIYKSKRNPIRKGQILFHYCCCSMRLLGCISSHSFHIKSGTFVWFITCGLWLFSWSKILPISFFIAALVHLSNKYIFRENKNKQMLVRYPWHLSSDNWFRVRIVATVVHRIVASAR